jgi:serralysin
MKRLHLFWAVLFSVLSTTTAKATFHLWQIHEVYSDPAGNVQFVELLQFTGTDDEDEFAGKVFKSDLNVFTFATNLPSEETANKLLLLGSTSYAALPGVPKPDYTLPDHFFNPAGDKLDYAGVDNFSFATLPGDGIHSLNRDGSTGINSPTNFAGDTGSIGGAVVPLPSGLLMGITAGPALFLIRRFGCIRD